MPPASLIAAARAGVEGPPAIGPPTIGKEMPSDRVAAVSRHIDPMC
jgi:hypothetical protein